MPKIKIKMQSWAEVLAGEIVREIPLTRGLFALVDDEDYPLLCKFKWNAHQRGITSYAQRCIKTRNYLMHRIILNAPEVVAIDHIDGNGLNNQKSNLRFATPRQNAQNRHHGKKTSKYVGVYKLSCNVKNCWRSEIYISGKLKSLGCYCTEEEAYNAYTNEVESLDEHSRLQEYENYCLNKKEHGE